VVCILAPKWKRARLSAWCACVIGWSTVLCASALSCVWWPSPSAPSRAPLPQAGRHPIPLLHLPWCLPAALVLLTLLHRCPCVRLGGTKERPLLLQALSRSAAGMSPGPGRVPPCQMQEHLAANQSLAHICPPPCMPPRLAG